MKKKFYSTDGQHIIADLYGCVDSLILDDARCLEAMVRMAIVAAKATLVSIHSHKFEPQGVTTIAIVEESAVTIHTYPESKFMAVDFYTCGKKSKPEKGVKYIIDKMQPKNVILSKVQRGHLQHLKV